MTTAAPDGFGTFRFSTKAMSEADRVTGLREYLGHLLRLDVETLPGAPLRADLTMRILPGLGVISGWHSPFRMGRTGTLVADGNDDLILLVRTGAGVLTQRTREIRVEPGESIMFSSAEIADYEFSTPAKILALNLPRAALRPLRGIDVSHPLPVARNGALRLLEDYFEVIGNAQVLDNAELGGTVVAHVYDLVALAIGANHDAAAESNERGLRAARLCAIKAYIANCLHRGCALSVGGLAARQRVTPRYIQMLFEGEGTTFTQFVLGERLARAHRMLVNPNLPDRGIAAVAFDAGFGDLSYFIRSFRRAYGARPSEVRYRAAKS